MLNLATLPQSSLLLLSPGLTRWPRPCLDMAPACSVAAPAGPQDGRPPPAALAPHLPLPGVHSPAYSPIGNAAASCMAGPAAERGRDTELTAPERERIGMGESARGPQGPTRVCSEWTGAKAGQPLGGSWGSPDWGSPDWRSGVGVHPSPCCSPLAMPPRNKHRDIHGVPEGPMGSQSGF